MSRFSSKANKRPLIGTVEASADKSISHRAIILAAIADGISKIRNFLQAHDCNATLDIIKNMGIKVDFTTKNTLIIDPSESKIIGYKYHDLNCQNSGTTMRLMAGLLCAMKCEARLVGTEQLHSRPMDRIIKPLQKMGADICGIDNKYAPLSILPSILNGINYQMPIASAQVKSAILLAGLYAKSKTSIIECGPSRNHTENLLKSMGADITKSQQKITVAPLSKPLKPLTITIPADPSSASFLVAAAAINEGSDIYVKNVCVNDTRTAFFEVLIKMGAIIEYDNLKTENNEKIADIHVKYHQLKAVELNGSDVVRMIDEIPLFALVATQASGVSVVKNAEELRVKESDRIESTCTQLTKIGANIVENSDGFTVIGKTKLTSAICDSYCDHRLAMMLLVAGTIIDDGIAVNNAHVYKDSFPTFLHLMNDLGADIKKAYE